MKDIKINQVLDKAPSPSLLEVRKINDLLRTTSLGIFGKTTLTKRVALSEYRDEIITAVREFDDFNESNDPYGEHDSAIVSVYDEYKRELFKVRFKIDYYDLNYEFGVDPESESCNRVLTIMDLSEI